MSQFIEVPLDAIGDIDFYLSPRLLAGAALDPVTASFLTSIGVETAIRAMADQVMPGLSDAFRFHKEERAGNIIFINLSWCEAAAPLEHRDHLAKLLQMLAKCAVPKAIQMMKTVQQMGSPYPGNRAARRRAARR